ncbi:MAG: hypothetical protein Q4C42_08105 [Clostridia bacterium]|nr:hypothetical protein [Clostridia bacterium]
MKIRIGKFLTYIDYVLIIIMILGAMFFAPEYQYLLFALIGVLLIALVLIGYIFLRCPHCGAYIMKNHNEYCKKCGKRIE